jgi:methylated-DNA-protein-cysteine methyltransferase related protein
MRGVVSWAMAQQIVISQFHQRAYETIRRIPTGRVATYQDVAAIMGSPGAARAVGTAMRMNPNPGPTPCHRVVRSDGSVGHYMGGPTGTQKKISMLRAEGVPVAADGRIQDFERVRWRAPGF